MPRYIDADELYKATQKRIAEANEARMAVVDDEFLDLIDDAFTEDVAPRAEVELWKGRTEAVFAAIPETRREFARKIFEEIEKLTFVSGFGGDVPNLVIMTEKDYAELKKKYTEAETEPPEDKR